MQTITSLSLTTIALDLAAAGIPVFPCKADKTPLTARGFKDATRDPATIRQLFSRPAAALIGVPTGAVSGFDVLDIDPRHGGHLWEAQHAGQLPETRIHQTGSGGRHWLFHHVDGVRNSASRVGPGVDVRGAGGYAVWWPVIHEAPITEWPLWLLWDVLGVAEPATNGSAPTELRGSPPAEITDARVAALIDQLLDNVRRAVDGSKHVTLRSNGISLGGYLSLAGWTEAQAVEQLVQALPASVTDWNLARRTAAWAVSQGVKRPQTLPDRPYDRRAA